MQDDHIILRNIMRADNAALARVIRKTMEEFDMNKPHTVYFEPTTDALFELFQAAVGSDYFVVELNGEVAGGAGIFPTDQLPEGVCELVKIYLSAAARGKGIGKQLIAKCLVRAKELNYNQVYLESSAGLRQAIGLYEKFGFQYLKAPIGNSGHTDTDTWMIKNI